MGKIETPYFTQKGRLIRQNTRGKRKMAKYYVSVKHKDWKKYEPATRGSAEGGGIKYFKTKEEAERYTKEYSKDMSTKVKEKKEVSQKGSARGFNNPLFVDNKPLFGPGSNNSFFGGSSKRKNKGQNQQ
jgi:hypothetical protein